MPLTPGLRLGVYEIVSLLGVGGMGEVYRARDTRLDRVVAIKVMPPELASDSHFRARFDREARIIARLQHPHICTLHDIGEVDGTTFLVMELLQGQTLAQRLTKGVLSLEEALKTASDVADALSAAHQQGIIHRDLKPANIMLTKAGAKLLDFGLAKSVGPVVRLGGDSTQGSASTHVTGSGTIVGTLHYMSPEQVEGQDADARSDLWALGCVTFEMLTGRQPFAGNSSASVVGAILKDRPDPVSAHREGINPAIDHVIARCVEKAPDDRWQTARDFREELLWAASAPSEPALPRRGNTLFVTAAIVAVAAAALGWLLARVTGRSPAPTVQRLQLSVSLPPGVRAIASPALSPDGHNLAIVGLGSTGAPTLWVRSLETGVARQLAGTEDASFPFWSPSSDAIGFFANGHLKALALTSSVPPKILATAQSGRGASWGSNHVIIYAPEANGPIMSVADTGGEPSIQMPADPARGQVGLRWPSFVDDRHFVFTTQGTSADVTGIYLGELYSTQATRLTGTYSSAAAGADQLLFILDGMLVGRTLDVEGRRFVGEPREIAGPVAFVRGLGFGNFSLAGDRLCFTGGEGPTTSALMQLDRVGGGAGLVAAGSEMSRLNSYAASISRDQRRLIVGSFQDATSDLWMIDLSRGTPSRLTSDGANEQYPVWSPDGTQVLFSSNRHGVYNLFRKAAFDSSAEQQLFESPLPHYASDWSADGRHLVFTVVAKASQADIWTSDADGSHAAAFIDGNSNEFGGRLSPDGRWMAYSSDESGRNEVYVQRFPEGGGKLQISTDGGAEPQWRGDGRELFYLSASRRLMAASFAPGAQPDLGRPQQVFDQIIDTSLGAIHAWHFAVNADGSRFYANVPTAATEPMSVVLNWRVEHRGREQ